MRPRSPLTPAADSPMPTTSSEAAHTAFNAAKEHLQSAQSAYRQGQETFQNLLERKSQLQAKVEQFQAAAQAADQEFKALFVENNFANTAPVKSAMQQKMANQDMANEVAAALAECIGAIEDFPFRKEVSSLANNFKSARLAACEAYTDMLLANALAEMPQSLVKALALRMHLSDINSADFKGAQLLPADLKEKVTRATRPIFNAIEKLAHTCDVEAELEAAGIAAGNNTGLPRIPSKTPAQCILHSQRKLTSLHSQR